MNATFKNTLQNVNALSFIFCQINSQPSLSNLLLRYMFNIILEVMIHVVFGFLFYIIYILQMSTSITSSTLGKKTYKIIFLGDSGSGKTSIIERFVNNHFQEKQNPTIGIDFIGKNINYKGTTCRLQLWDTAGQERFRSLIPSYLKDAVCAIFVFDVQNPESLSSLSDWIQLYRDNRGQKSMSILCGNKSDLEKNFDKKQLEVIMEKNKLPYHTISAKTGNNIDNLFYAVVDMINEHQIARQKKYKLGKEEQQSHIPPMTDKPLRLDQVKEQDSKVEENIELNGNGGKRKRFFCC